MKYLNINQLSEILAGRSVNAIYIDIKNGDLPPPVKIGNRNYWDEVEVRAHLKALRDKQQSTPPARQGSAA